jgi:uracil-DNA glycosylase
MGRPDARKTLPELREEWRSCVKCPLGHDRINRDGLFVFGQGTTGSIMLIGEGPGAEEEKMGVPFVGKSGDLLRRAMKLVHMDEFYISNLVACRSCAQQYNEDGSPAFRKNWTTGKPELHFRDEPPTPPQYNACSPRLYEEIYLVDPIVIVGLGAMACEALLGKHITITRDRGDTAQIEIPGASFLPALTDKKEAWARKTREGLVTPVVQNTVRYHFIPTLHPAYVIRKLDDRGPDSPLMQLLVDLGKAVRTYEAYREIVFGTLPTNAPIDYDLLQREFQDEGE